MAEFCSPLFISFIPEESQPRVRRRLCLAPHHSSRREIDVSPPPHAPLLPPSQIQARCQRENKQKTEEEKQKGVDGFSANAIKRLFTSEGEEPAGCQAAGGGRSGRGGGALAPKQVDGVIYLFLFLTEQSNNTAAGSATAVVRGIQSTRKVLVRPDDSWLALKGIIRKGRGRCRYLAARSRHPHFLSMLQDSGMLPERWRPAGEPREREREIVTRRLKKSWKLIGRTLGLS